MAFKLAVFAAIFAYANAGLLGAPAVAHYSAAPAVSSSYIHQASAPVAYAQAAPVAYAQAAPVAYAHAAPVAAYAAHSYAAPVAISAPAIGASHQSVLRSLGGNQAVSHYSKAVDSAFSSVRKFDTRFTNDALSLGVAHAPVAVAHSAPYAVAHSAPLAYAHAPVAAVAHAPAAVAYSPAAVVSHVSFSGLGASYGW